MEQQELANWIRSLIRHKNVKAFYNSAAWQAMREEVLVEQHHECQMCRSKGLYVPAATVHHKKHVKQYPELALTKDNLIAVCEDCHYDIHHRAETKPQLNKERW